MATLPRERAADVRALFHELFDESADARDKRLAAIEASDIELAAFVRRLLGDADRRAAADEEQTGPQKTADRFASGSVIAGRYRVLRPLGQGGMGDVYLAERVNDIEQKVALKLMRDGNASLVNRFVRERRILARLSHPHIAHLIDGGLSETGVPWFAMEYVDGVSITDACDRAQFDLRARVCLTVQICHAVQFAHRNLVLHRDLKPSNILVDGEGAPKLLDFGIAKLLDETEPDKTRTLTMTPAYASPEQLRGDSVTTASDVYQIGLVLHELLTGMPARELRRRRTIAHDAAKSLPRLDQLFAQTMPDAAAHIARDRGLAPARLTRALRGDLDRIVATASADDPRQRYETAQALGDDLERWLAGRPVRAQRGSFGYRLGKLVRRNVAAAALIALLAVGLIAAAVFSFDRAQRERVQRVLAEQQRQRAETAFNFMGEVFRQGDPSTNQGKEIPATELFRRAAGKLDARADIDSITRALLLTQIGEIFLRYNHADDARACADRALAVLEPMRENYPNQYFDALFMRVEALSQMDLSQEVIDATTTALPFAKRMTGGPTNWYADLLSRRGTAANDLGHLDAAEFDLRAAISQYDAAGSEQDAQSARSGLALLLADRGDPQQALALFQRVAAVAARTQDNSGKIIALYTQYNIGSTYLYAGDPRSAVAALAPLLTPCDIKQGVNPFCRDIRTVLVRAYVSLGDYAKARTLFDAGQVTPLPSDVQSPEHKLADVLTAARLDLASLHGEEALAKLRGVERSIQSLPESMRRMRAESMFAEAALQTGQCDEAEPLLEGIVARTKRIVGDTPSLTLAESEDGLGRCVLRGGDLARAREHFSHALEALRRTLDPASPELLRSEIHALWVEALATHDSAALDRMNIKRAALVAALGGEDKAQVWQLDLLLDELSRQLGHPGIEPARRRRAEEGLKALSGTAKVPHFVGLNDFS